MIKFDMVEIPTIRPENLPALTSLRFVAAAMIVAAHSDSYFALPRIAAYVALTQSVSFFFVLSGFIMSHRYRSDAFFSPSRFLKARIARIWPLHVVTLLCWIAADPKRQAFDLAHVPELLANLFLMQSWVPTKSFVFSFNAPSWSLSTEIGFYLAFPALLMLRRRGMNQSWILAGSMSSAGAFVMLSAFRNWPLLGNSTEAALIGTLLANPLCRLAEFALGMWIHELVSKSGHRSSISATYLQILAVGFCGLSMWGLSDVHLAGIRIDALRYYIGWCGSAPAFAFLIYTFSMRRGRLSARLGSKPLVFLGEISFAIYLVHVPMIQAVERWSLLSRSGLASWAVYLLAVVAAATALHVSVETPARQLIMARRRSVTSSLATTR